MYGSLAEIDLSSLLNFFSEQQRSGILFIEHELSTISQKNIYFLFFSTGKVVFAGDRYSFGFQRIEDYLSHYNLTDQFNSLQKNLNVLGSFAEYEAILLLQSQQLVPPGEIKNIGLKIIEEIFFQIISLNQGHFIWHNSFNLQPIIINIEIPTILPSIICQQVAWQKLSPYMTEIEACPLIIEKKEDFFFANKEPNLFNCIDGKTSLLQLSRRLNYDVVKIGNILYPHIQTGSIKIIKSEIPESASDSFLSINSQIIAFSTSNHWTLNLAKFSLLPEYNVLIPDDINQLFTYIFNIPLKLIILESQIENNYNTYNLCKIIRNNSRTSNLPIIMVVNQYIFKDNLISKMHGVTEYISQTTFQKQMLNIIDKYL